MMSPFLLGEKKCEEDHPQNDLNQDDEKSAVIDDHVSQGESVRPIPFRKPPSQGDADRKEQEDENRHISMQTRGKKSSLQVEMNSGPD